MYSNCFDVGRVVAIKRRIPEFDTLILQLVPNPSKDMLLIDAHFEELKAENPEIYSLAITKSYNTNPGERTYKLAGSSARFAEARSTRLTSSATDWRQDCILSRERYLASRKTAFGFEAKS